MCQEADIEKPFVSTIYGNECIDKETFFEIYQHELGPDCMAGTSDDGPRDPQYCPPGFEYNFDFCSCISTDTCIISRCSDDKVPNPLKCGECLTTEALEELKVMMTMGFDD